MVFSNKDRRKKGYQHKRDKIFHFRDIRENSTGSIFCLGSLSLFSSRPSASASAMSQVQETKAVDEKPSLSMKRFKTEKFELEIAHKKVDTGFSITITDLSTMNSFRVQETIIPSVVSLEEFQAALDNEHGYSIEIASAQEGDALTLSVVRKDKFRPVKVDISLKKEKKTDNAVLAERFDRLEFKINELIKKAPKNFEHIKTCLVTLEQLAYSAFIGKTNVCLVHESQPYKPERSTRDGVIHYNWWCSYGNQRAHGLKFPANSIEP